MTSGGRPTHRSTRWRFRWRRRGRQPSAAQAGALALAVCLFAVVVGLLIVRAPSDEGVPGGATTVSAPLSSTPAPTPAPSGPPSRERVVLEHWDDARTAAWAAGDARALGALYTPGSRAGAADVSMLRAWSARGLRVSGLRLQVLTMVVRSSSPSRFVLLVTDREVGAVAHHGPQAQPLPGDRPSRHLVTFVRTGGRWLVASSLPR